MDKYKKLARNSAIFAVANMGSRLMAFLLVPFYTYILSKEEYGLSDTLTTTINLLYPVISFTIYEASMRFVMEDSYNKRSVLTNSIFVVMVSYIVFLPMYFFVSKIYIFHGYEILFYLILIMQSINCILSQFARGIGKIRSFAYSGIIYSLCLLVSSIAYLWIFDLKIVGYLLSILTSYVISNILLLVQIKAWNYIIIDFLDLHVLKKMMKYSIPLIPNYLMWWVLNASNRYIIIWYLGFGMNGLYAVACKIPTIITMVQQIFMQAWQISAIEENKTDKDAKFYSNIFGLYQSILFITFSGTLLFVKPIFHFILPPEYHITWKYVPWLLYAAIYSGLSSFLGTFYTISYKTQNALKSSVAAAIINISFNFILTPVIGLNGTCFATMVSYLVLWIIRIIDTKSIIKIEYDKKCIVISNALAVIQCISLICFDRLWFIFGTLCFMFITITNLLCNKENLYKQRMLKIQ